MKNISLAFCAVLILLAAPALAKNPHKSTPAHGEYTAEDALVNAAERIFTAAERALITEYFGAGARDNSILWDDNRSRDRRYDDNRKKKDKQLPPGLAKRKHLPPGLQKQLDKNGCLPSGLAKRDLPANLLKKLPKPPKGTKRVIVGSDVLLIDAATNYVLDVIENAIRSK